MKDCVENGAGPVESGPDGYGEVPEMERVELNGIGVMFGRGGRLLGDAVTVIVRILPWRGADAELPETDGEAAGEVELDAVTGEPGVEEVATPVPVSDVFWLTVVFKVETSVFVNVFVDAEYPEAHGVEELLDAVM